MPTGAITAVKPTFKWSKAARATRYEVRVYRGSTLKLKKTGITKLSWKSTTALPKNVGLTWKVRAGNAGGNGAWSKNLTFKISVVPLAIGDSYQGGKVAYILHSGDPGYDANVRHGLIAAVADQSTGMYWWNGSFMVIGATGTALGTGFANTNLIIAAQGDPSESYAAGLARAYTVGGYTDWYLPSQDELNKLYVNQAVIGGFGSAIYWSSTEVPSDYARGQYFLDGYQGTFYRDVTTIRVRAVRSF